VSHAPRPAQDRHPERPAPRAPCFLIGGPGFAGTTLLTFLLDTAGVACLDEPDFHNPEQRHRGIPVLRRKFPGATFPDPPTRPTSYEAAVDLLQACQAAIAPRRLGMKTCNDFFLGHADVFRARGWPVVAIVRDPRDALVRAPEHWVREAAVNRYCRGIWNRREEFDLWIRYEDLVAAPAETLARVGDAIGERVELPPAWSPEDVDGTYLKLDRHHLLLSGGISSERVGIWRAAGRTFSAETHETARLMGYAG
jgi:hypothetical protein